MTELSFARQFLSALDSRPIKLNSDHISDPKSYPAQSAFTLPKLPHPPHPQRPSKPTSTTTSAPTEASSASISITLKPMRSTQQTIALDSIPVSTTSIYDLKSTYSQKTSTDISKIKILYKKKPAADTKTVSEILGPDGSSPAEFSVMIMGGAAGAAGAGASSSPAGSGAASPAVEIPEPVSLSKTAAQGASGKEVLGTEEFWEDLKGFLVQRLRDEEEGEKLVVVFRGAWEKF